MIEIKKLFGDTLIYGVSSVIARVLNFLLVPLYTWKFMPSEYAVLAEIYAYAAFLIVLGSFGMETSFFRFSKEKNQADFSVKKNNSAVFSSSFLFLLMNASVLFFISIFFSQNIAQNIGYAMHPEYIQYFLLIVAVDLTCIIPFAFLRQKNQAIKFATIKTINIFINIIFNLLLLVVVPHFYSSFEVSVEYVFLSNLIASISTLLILFPEIYRNVKYPDYQIFKKMVGYSWPILVAGIAFVINETADKILLKYFLPSDGSEMEKLGVYAACYKLTIFMTLFVQAYRFAAEPFFFNQFTKPNAKEIYSRMMQLFILLSLYIFLFVVLHIDIIKFMIRSHSSVGEISYHEGLVIIPIVLMANIFLGIYYNLSVWYKVTNKTKYGAGISLLGAGITILLNIIFIPLYGYIASAWVTLICYGTMMIISFFLGQKHFKIHYKIKPIALYFLLTLSVFYCSTLLKNQGYNNIQIFNTTLFIICTIFIYTQVKNLMFDVSKKQHSLWKSE